MTVQLQKRVVEEIEEDVSNDGGENSEESDNENQGCEEEVDADDEDNIQDDDDEDDDDAEENTGWANTFASLLKQEKPKNKKYLVLSKAKKLADRKNGDETETSKVTFEIEGKESSDVENENKPTQDDLKIQKLIHDEKDKQLLSLRVKPTPLDKERERALKRIATKGVVQLFNAVRTQQKDLQERLREAGPLDHKRDAVLNNINKRQFLDVLMGGKRARSENVDNPVKDEIKMEGENGKPSQWSVLRNDFMTNKKLASHWDDENDNDDTNDQQMKSNGNESDSS